MPIPSSKRIASLAALQRFNASRWSYERDVNEKLGDFDKIRQKLKDRKIGRNGVGCLEFTCYNMIQMITFLSMAGTRKLAKYSDQDVSELVEAMAKFIMRLMFDNAEWDVYERSNGPLRYAYFSRKDYVARYGKTSVANCNWKSWYYGGAGPLFNKKNYQLHVMRCVRTSTVAKLLGIVAHEVAHEISTITFKQYVEGNDHDDIWHNILMEIERRIKLLNLPYVRDESGYDPNRRNH